MAISIENNEQKSKAGAASAAWGRVAREAITDERAFTALYEHFFPRVYKHLLAKTHDHSLADELVSNTFFKMYDHLRDYDPSKGAFSTWLFRIAHNELATYYRSKNYTDTADPDWERPEERALSEERSGELKAALGTLSERDRKIIEMTYWLGMKSEEVAKALNMQPNTVRVALKRSREALKKILS